MEEKPGRNFTDLPDVDDGYNIHVMYVLPKDGLDIAKRYVLPAVSDPQLATFSSQQFRVLQLVTGSNYT